MNDCLAPAVDKGGQIVGQIATLKCIPIFFSNITNAALTFAAIAAVFFLVIGGLKLLTSSGDPLKVQNAKKTITFSIIGLVIILTSYTLINVVAKVTNTQCIKAFGFDTCQ